MLQIFPKKFLGIDIGTTAIRIVEVNNRRALENYGEIYAKDLNTPFIRFENNTIILSEDLIAQSIRAVIAEAGIKTKKVFVSFADFSSFFTTFTMPKMSEKELEQAVQFEAKKYIPIPLNNVTMDWQIIDELPPAKEGTLGEYRVLVVAIANEIIDQYQRVIAKCGLELMGFEAEVFSLVRALIGADARITAIVDFGSQSSTVTIVENGLIKDSHSLDFSGEKMLARLMKDLSIDRTQAATLRDNAGITGSDQKTAGSLLPMMNMAVQEVDRIFREFNRSTGKNLQRIIVAGGMVLMPGFADFFAKQFSRVAPIEMANAFATVSYKPPLKPVLERMSPAFAIAAGLALKGAE